jgi:hypothetical protein
MKPRLGDTPTEKALVTMWERRAELEGFAAVMEGIRNASAGLKGRDCRPTRLRANSGSRRSKQASGRESPFRS